MGSLCPLPQGEASLEGGGLHSCFQGTNTHPWSLTMTTVYWAQDGSKWTKSSGERKRERGVWCLWRGAQQISSLRLGCEGGEGGIKGCLETRKQRGSQ